MFSQYIAQPIPSGSYQQKYHTIIINTSISGPTLISNKNPIIRFSQLHLPFVEKSFLQASSPVSTPPVPSPIDLNHQ